MKEIARIETPFKEKFGIPRQPRLVPEARGIIRLKGEFAREEIVAELASFTHLWLIFIFHNTKGWSPSVRPPRLGGNKKVGVFASRSPFRPNPIGLSVVKLEKIEKKQDCLEVHVGGVDLLDGTPILDIKPYLPEIDCVEDAGPGWAGEYDFPSMQVRFSTEAQAELQDRPELKDLITGILKQDPRPAYKRDSKEEFAFLLDRYNVRWEESDTGVFTVLSLETI